MAKNGKRRASVDFFFVFGGSFEPLFFLFFAKFSTTIAPSVGLN
jgi:hypothetical protein